MAMAIHAAFKDIVIAETFYRIDFAKLREDCNGGDISAAEFAEYYPSEEAAHLALSLFFGFAD